MLRMANKFMVGQLVKEISSGLTGIVMSDRDEHPTTGTAFYRVKFKAGTRTVAESDLQGL